MTKTLTSSSTRGCRTLRSYREPSLSYLRGDAAGYHRDIRGQQAKYPDVDASDRYDESQQFGEEVRASSGGRILYTNLRHQSGNNIVAFRTHNITDIVQEDHFEITVSSTDRTINLRKLSR